MEMMDKDPSPDLIGSLDWLQSRSVIFWVSQVDRLYLGWLGMGNTKEP